MRASKGRKARSASTFAADGTAKPYRDNVRAPSFANQTRLSQIAVGHNLADAVAILGSFDIVMGEVDR